MGDFEAGQAGMEMHARARTLESFTQGGNDSGEFVRADVRMGLDEDVRVRAEVHEVAEGGPQVTAFVAARVQFAVAVGPRAAFAEAVVRIGVDLVFARDADQIPPALPHRGTAIHQDGSDAVPHKGQRSEEAGGAHAHHENFRCAVRDGRQFRERKRVGGQREVHRHRLDGQDGAHRAAPGIEGAPDDPVRPHWPAERFGHRPLDRRGVNRVPRRQPDFEAAHRPGFFLCHGAKIAAGLAAVPLRPPCRTPFRTTRSGSTGET